MREGCKGGKRYLMLVVAVMVVVVVGDGSGRCSGGTNWIEDFFQLSASIFFGGGFTGPNTAPISNNCVNSFIIAFSLCSDLYTCSFIVIWSSLGWSSLLSQQRQPLVLILPLLSIPRLALKDFFLSAIICESPNLYKCTFVFISFSWFTCFFGRSPQIAAIMNGLKI